MTSFKTILIVAVAGVGAAVGWIAHTTTTRTVDVVRNAPARTITVQVAPPAPKLPAPKPAAVRGFAGSGDENVGTIRVARDSRIRWSCPQCDAFAIVNSVGDTSQIALDANGPHSGVTVLPAGVYHSVTVLAAGGWSFKVEP